jgi:hypothetical protein
MADAARNVCHSFPKEARMNEPDRYETMLYYIEALNLFHRVDYRAKPCAHSWVVVERLDNGQLVLEQFRGQSYIGVVRPLNDYFAQPAWRAEERRRIAESGWRRLLTREPPAEESPKESKKKKPGKEKNPFPRNLAC